MGKQDHALAMVELCWGGMNKLGGTSYWEVFSPDWLTALDPSDPVPNFQARCSTSLFSILECLTRAITSL